MKITYKLIQEGLFTEENIIERFREMKYNYDKIINNLIFERLKKKLKQSDIAEVLGITHSMYSILENKKCTLNAIQLLKLLNYYEVSLEDLMND